MYITTFPTPGSAGTSCDSDPFDKNRGLPGYRRTPKQVRVSQTFTFDPQTIKHLCEPVATVFDHIDTLVERAEFKAWLRQYSDPADPIPAFVPVERAEAEDEADCWEQASKWVDTQRSSKDRWRKTVRRAAIVRRMFSEKQATHHDYRTASLAYF